MLQIYHERQVYTTPTANVISFDELQYCRDTIYRLEQENAALKQENKAERFARARAEEKLTQSEESARTANEKIASMRDEITLIYKWSANPNMQPYAKAVLTATFRAIQEAKYYGAEEKNGKVHIWQKRVANLGGISVSTVSDYWQVLKDSGVLEIENVPVREGHGIISTFTYVCLTPVAMFNGAAFEVSKAKKKGAGGKRIPRCPHCKSLDLQKETKYTCRNCSVTGMTKKQLLMDTEEFIAIEAEMNAQLQQDLEVIAKERQSEVTPVEEEAQELDETPQEPEEIAESFQSPIEEETQEETQELDNTHTYAAPDRDCFVCGKREWQWNGNHWACNHEGGQS